MARYCKDIGMEYLGVVPAVFFPPVVTFENSHYPGYGSVPP